MIRRVGKGSLTSTQSDIYYFPPENGKYRTREARRKRRSKADQEKYFEDFPTEGLSIANFTYVRRPLELNNAAYEVVRKARNKDDGDNESNGGGGKKKGGKAAASSSSTRNSIMSSSASSSQVRSFLVYGRLSYLSSRNYGFGTPRGSPWVPKA